MKQMEEKELCSDQKVNKFINEHYLTTYIYETKKTLNI